ncbi:GNAT family N-acetyltransferase [Frigoribacterium sp. PhB24]|uniref:GNAT family N-acetyltransferase n=1 Tax=Frigoribacterium sp. PhB24 TaxID=2485204 RepID=UPI000F45FB0A|nr:GNAT family N-acetyltransferase [Frigoribacterium sp. PhB24]ROS54734.1 CelD/BcsL family acetyltransferase involved in cellulose biosynthesis [Frigoribacterium sp. PhB24]
MPELASFEVLDRREPEQLAAWLSAWAASDDADPFGHPTHVDLFAGPSDAAHCAVFTWNGGSILLPFVLRAIDGTRHRDVTSAYGYGGPFTSGEVTMDRWRDFWAGFAAWCTGQGVVSEFLRFSTSPDPLDIAYPGQLHHRSTTVVRTLDLEPDALWMDFEHKVRKSVNKARRSGVEISVDTEGERLEEFLAIYEGTMERRGAHERYLFGRRFFERIRDEMSGSFVFFHADVDGTLVSTELVLTGRNRLYSYLGGSDESAFALRPNDLLKHSVMTWGMARGATEFVLGGGAAPGDGIERYKLSFASDGAHKFFTGQRIVDSRAYDRLAAQRAITDTSFFPAYRAEQQ